MTREEAIEILRDTPIDIRSTREDDIHSLYATAQDMAIEALHTDLVRCKDCKNRYLFSCPLDYNDFNEDEDFCSWGKKREAEE